MIWHGLTRIREAFEGSSKALGHLTLDLDPYDLVLNVFHEGDMRASPWDARCAVEIPGSGTEWVWENNSHSQFVIIVCTCSHLFSMITFWRWSDYEFIESHFSKSITLHQSVVWYEHELTHALRCSEHCIIWAYADDFEARKEPWGKQSKTRWREGTQKQREEYLGNVVFWIMPTDKDTPFQLK